MGEIRVHLHFDPNLGQFEVRPRLYRTKQARFYTRKRDKVEWLRRAFEPTDDDDIHIHYHPRMVVVTIAGEAYAARFRADRYLRNGVLMVPASWMQEELGAQVILEAGTLRIARGSSTITLHSGEFLIRPIPKGDPFPPPEDVDHAELLMPLARVVRALGARIAYYAATRTVRVILPRQENQTP